MSLGARSVGPGRLRLASANLNPAKALHVSSMIGVFAGLTKNRLKERTGRNLRKEDYAVRIYS